MLNSSAVSNITTGTSPDLSTYNHGFSSKAIPKFSGVRKITKDSETDVSPINLEFSNEENGLTQEDYQVLEISQDEDGKTSPQEVTENVVYQPTHLPPGASRGERGRRQARLSREASGDRCRGLYACAQGGQAG